MFPFFDNFPALFEKPTFIFSEIFLIPHLKIVYALIVQVSMSKLEDGESNFS